MRHLSKWRFAILLIVFGLSLSCAVSYDARGRYYKVRKGDDISKIAKYYGISLQELAEWNNIKDPSEVIPGYKLYIPSRQKHSARRTRDISGSERKKGKVEAKEARETIRFETGRFDWPVTGKIISGFGIRKGRRHDGVDIKAESGTPIHAAADGVVVFEGKMRGYGNVIIIRHKDHFFTVYAHNSKNLASRDQKVSQGEVIGYIGKTGNATTPHLHFEIREGEMARNPLYLMSPPSGEGMVVAKADYKGKAVSKDRRGRLSKDGRQERTSKERSRHKVDRDKINANRNKGGK